MEEESQLRQRGLAETVFGMTKQKNGECLTLRGHMQQRKELLPRMIPHIIKRLNFLECAEK